MEILAVENKNMDNLLTIGLKSKTITGSDDVMDCLKTALLDEKLHEKDILVISSKVVAVTQGKIRDARNESEFEKLVESEADEMLGGEMVILTKKNNIFIPWAGIDRSNVPEGKAVLWPDKPFETAYKLLQQLKTEFKLKELGVIISDSICTPLRRGVTAIALGYAGFEGVNDLRGKRDLYNKELKVSQQNLADMISAAANLVMGESTESMPFAIVRGAKVVYTQRRPDPLQPIIPQDQCLFGPLYKK